MVSKLFIPLSDFHSDRLSLGGVLAPRLSLSLSSRLSDRSRWKLSLRSSRALLLSLSLKICTKWDITWIPFPVNTVTVSFLTASFTVTYRSNLSVLLLSGLLSLLKLSLSRLSPNDLSLRLSLESMDRSSRLSYRSTFLSKAVVSLRSDIRLSLLSSYNLISSGYNGITITTKQCMQTKQPMQNRQNLFFRQSWSSSYSLLT